MKFFHDYPFEAYILAVSTIGYCGLLVLEILNRIEFRKLRDNSILRDDELEKKIYEAVANCYTTLYLRLNKIDAKIEKLELATKINADRSHDLFVQLMYLEYPPQPSLGDFTFSADTDQFREVSV